MIKVVAVSLTQARVEFVGVKAHGVPYKGYYHAVLKNNEWRGVIHSEHEGFDSPLNSYTALSATREDTPFVDATRAARKKLAEICLAAVVEHEQKFGHEFITAERNRLVSERTRCREREVDARKALEDAQDATDAAAKAAREFCKKHNLDYSEVA